MLEKAPASPAGLRLSSNRPLASLLALGVILLIVAIAGAAYTFSANSTSNRMVEHTLLVESSVNRIAAYNEQLETGRRGFLLTGQMSFRAITEQAETSLENELVTLARLTRDNPRQTDRIMQIADLHAERLQLLDRLFADPAVRRATLAGDFSSDRAVTIVRTIRALTANMARNEALLLRQRNGEQYRSLVLLYSVGGLALALLLVVLGAVIWLIWRYNSSLSRAQTVLRQLNEGLEDAVAARTAELQRANQEIQRFAYIVSHDLRSPLVNVLGFTAELDEARKSLRAYLADLYERHPALRDDEAWRSVDEDLPEALAFIRTSTEKMDRLINSILQLSRQGRRQLSPEPLDLGKLVEGAIQTLHQRIADAGARVTTGDLPPIESDRIAIEQILSNLLENALKYLQPGRPGEIRVEGRRSGPNVEIDVIDNGRGIAPADHERIFELFRRSGKQDTAGEGIGLANVRALAYRLGGIVEVESQLDQGSRFRLSLPAKFVAMEVPA